MHTQVCLEDCNVTTMPNIACPALLSLPSHLFHAGLPHLPVQLLRLDNLSILAASNNRLQQLSCQETEVPTLTSPRCGVPRSRSPSPSRSTAAAEGARSSTSRRKPAGQEGTAAAGGAAAGLGTPLPDTLTVLGWAANELEELPEDLGQQLPLLEVADLTCNR
jgi:hypothetical protein